jgi:hypothetical protein
MLSPRASAASLNGSAALPIATHSMPPPEDGLEHAIAAGRLNVANLRDPSRSTAGRGPQANVHVPAVAE